MNRTIFLNRNLLNFGIPLGLLVVLISLMESSFLNGNNHLSFAITADLLLTVPLVYFLLIRKSQIPKTTVILVMVIGLLIGSYYLPKESQAYLDLFKRWALPVIELSILIFVIFKVRKAINAFKEQKSITTDFYDVLKWVCNEMLPQKVVLPLVTEIAVFYYGFMDWKNRPLQEKEFTYHKNSGTPALFYAFILIICIETIALHFLLAKWSPGLAWILTGLSLYTAIQVLGFAKAFSKRPISIEEGMLMLRYGIMNETRIPLLDIEAISLSKKRLEKDKLTKSLSPLGELESQNVVINLKRENTLIGLYGFRKKYKIIGLYMDEPNDFKEKLENAMREANSFVNQEQGEH